MLNTLLHRIARRLPVLPTMAMGHVAVCPPMFLDTEPAGRYSASRWLRARRENERCSRVEQVKNEFCDAVTEIRSERAALLLERIARARSLLELWHLRPDLFDLVALHHSQDEAERRLARLNRHYPTRSPRSGFAPL